MVHGYIISKDKNIIEEFYKNISEFMEVSYTYISKEYRVDFWSWNAFPLCDFLYECVFKYCRMNNVRYCVEFQVGEKNYGR